MKNKVVALTLGLGLAGAMSSMALGIPSSGTLRLETSGTDPGYGSADGGEFFVDIAPNKVGGFDFKSFCLEKGEDINIGTWYNYAVNPDQAAVGGGGGAVGGKDVISKGTAWLFSQFAAGTLAGYNYGSPDLTENSLQNAIWHLEQEITLANPLLNPFYALASGVAGYLSPSTYGEYGTYVLNVTEGTTKRQDLLYWERPTVADGGMTLLMLGAGLTMIGIARRRLA